MGHKVEIDAWIQFDDGHYEYAEAYRGRSIIRGLLVALRLRISGIGCIRIEWRP